jgi:serine/threonine protein kinase
VCALKVMSKKLLFKLDEVRHVLTERDILTTARSEWLVRLLYAFQDEKSIFLAMVSGLLWLSYSVMLTPPGICSRWRFSDLVEQYWRATQSPRSLLHRRNVHVCRLAAPTGIHP